MPILEANNVVHLSMALNWFDFVFFFFPSTFQLGARVCKLSKANQRAVYQFSLTQAVSRCKACKKERIEN